MKHISFYGALVGVFAVGLVGAAAFTAEHASICEDKFVQEFASYLEHPDLGYESPEQVISHERESIGATGSEYSTKELADSGSDAAMVIEREGSPVYAFVIRETASGRYLANGQIVCLDEKLEPIDRSLDLSSLTTFREVTPDMTDPDWIREMGG